MLSIQYEHKSKLIISIELFIVLLFVHRPRFATLGEVEDTRLYKDVARFSVVTIEIIYKCILLFYAKAHQHFKIKILRFDESLYACNAPFFKRKFYELIGIYSTKSSIIPCGEEAKNIHVNEVNYKYVILDCSPFNYIDTVGVKLLIQVRLRDRK